jgi:phospholipase C
MRSYVFASLAACSLWIAGCSSEDTAATSAAPKVVTGPPEWNRQVDPPSDADAEKGRADCAFAAGSLPAETQGVSHPSGEDIPVDHIIITMMENRSFDHYYGNLPAYGQPDVDVAPADATNPDPNGLPVARYHDTQYCLVDTNHGWDGTHRQIHGGAMDGFVTTNDGYHELPANGTLEMVSGRRAMAYYDETDLPFYYWLANEFTIADRYFSSVPGPTWPNRMYLYAATSVGAVKNTLRTAEATIFDNLEKRQISWKIYVDGAPSFSVFPNEYLEYREEHIRTIDEFRVDVAAGNLPQVAIVEPYFGITTYDNNDEHPPAIMQIGQKYVAELIESVTKSPAWPRTAMFLTYDEHGGYYDHVPPPKACAPLDHAAEVPEGGEPGDFDQYGVRVPFLLVSPFAKKHHVSHEVYDHTSILRFIEARFILPAMTGRDANAMAPWEMFDFEGAPHLTPPAIPVPEIDPAKLDACRAIFEE